MASRKKPAAKRKPSASARTPTWHARIGKPLLLLGIVVIGWWLWSLNQGLAALATEVRGELGAARYLQARERIRQWDQDARQSADDARDAIKLPRFFVKPITDELEKRHRFDLLRNVTDVALWLDTVAPDQHRIDTALKALESTHAADVNVRVQRVRYRLRFDTAFTDVTLPAEAAEVVAKELAAELDRITQAESTHAEAWSLRALVIGTYLGDVQSALPWYAKAASLDAANPAYAANVARALLDLGRYEEAVGRYRVIHGYVLAHAERALGQWALGRFDDAAQSLEEAQSLRASKDSIDPDRVPYNTRSWLFRFRYVQDAGIELNAWDQDCYVALNLMMSYRLADPARPAFPYPPKTCPKPREKLRFLVADDLCRFVDENRPALAATTRALRHLLVGQEACDTLDAAYNN